MVHLFDELIHVLPVGIHLTRLEGEQNILVATGYSESNTYVSQLMKNMENSQWINTPILSAIRWDDTRKSAPNEFKLSFRLASSALSGGYHEPH